ncbi:hypothetical protein AAMO2058_000993100 [Amorphochlora amoebiformis]
MTEILFRRYRDIQYAHILFYFLLSSRKDKTSPPKFYFLCEINSSNFQKMVVWVVLTFGVVIIVGAAEREASKWAAVHYLPVILEPQGLGIPNTNLEFLGKLPPGSSSIPSTYMPDQYGRNLLRKLALIKSRDGKAPAKEEDVADLLPNPSDDDNQKPGHNPTFVLMPQDTSPSNLVGSQPFGLNLAGIAPQIPVQELVTPKP